VPARIGAVVDAIRGTLARKSFTQEIRFTTLDLVTEERLACGALYPPMADLRSVSRAIAIAVVGTIGTIDGEPLPAGDEGIERAARAVDAAIWWPDYQPYEPA